MAHTITTNTKWKDALEDQKLIKDLIPVLSEYMHTTRWYAAKTEEAKRYKIERYLALPVTKTDVVFAITIEINFTAGFTEYYFLTLAICDEDVDEKGVICEATFGQKKGKIIDALYWEAFRKFIFQDILKQNKYTADNHILTFEKGKVLKSKTEYEHSRVLPIDQSNTSIDFNGKYFLKVYRRLFQDTNPDLELTKYLSDEAGYKNAPKFAGSISWRRGDYSIISIGHMQEKIENEGEAWTLTLEDIRSFFNRIDETKKEVEEIEDVPLFEQRKIKQLDDETVDLIGYRTLKNIQTIAKRVAEMHIALFKNRYDTSFNPVAFNPDYTVWLKNRIIYQFNARYILVEQNLGKLKGLAHELAENFLSERDTITNEFLGFIEHQLNSQRIRIHGDLHLGQILVGSDEDFYIIDFEGEPESTIRDRKVKQTPLKDVAGLLRSYHYAVYAVIFDKKFKSKLTREEQFAAGEKYYQCVLSIFMNTYLETAMSSNMDVGYYPEIVYLLKYHLLEKAVYEIGYELKARPDWVIIPLSGVKQILESNLKLP